MEADLSDLSDSWRDMYSANFQINQINPFHLLINHRFSGYLFEHGTHETNGFFVSFVLSVFKLIFNCHLL